MSDDRTADKNLARVLWILFTLFVVYGTTIPFYFDLEILSPDQLAARVNWTFLGDGSGHSLYDVVQNVLLFIPFGFLGYLSLVNQRSRLKETVLILLGAALSIGVEFLQVFSGLRHAALSDVVTNIIGTAVGTGLGSLLNRSVVGLKSHAWTRRILDAEPAYPALVFMALVGAGWLEPFDFTLDMSQAWDKIKPWFGHPINIKVPNDDLAGFILFLMATLFICRLAQSAGLRKPALSGVLFMSLTGFGLEAIQIFVISRSPDFQDALVALLGALAGGIAFRFPGFRDHPVIWGGTGVLAVCLSAAMRGLYPFRFKSWHSGYNWIPFLPRFERTSFASLWNFVESGMIFFPMGFMLAYFFPGSRRARWLAVFLAVAAAAAVETAQGWIVGRHSDVTDVLGALIGVLLGIMAVTRGWRTYRYYLVEEHVPMKESDEACQPGS